MYARMQISSMTHVAPCISVYFTNLLARTCWSSFLTPSFPFFILIAFTWSACTSKYISKNIPQILSVTSSTNNKISGQVLIIISFFLHVWTPAQLKSSCIKILHGWHASPMCTGCWWLSAHLIPHRICWPKSGVNNEFLEGFHANFEIFRYLYE